MSVRGSSPSSKHCDGSISRASDPDERSQSELIRSVGRRRSMEWRREEVRREQGLQAQPRTRMSFAERVRAQVRTLFSRTTEDVSDEGETDSESEEGVKGGGNPGVGIVWRSSFFATMSLFAYVFLSGPRVQANLVPDISERDAIPRITRPRKRPRTKT